MGERENWIIYLEGFGPSHLAGDARQANRFMLEALKELKAAGHSILQARFTSNRGEENWQDPATLEMHEGLCKKDLHEELVEMGVKANATREQSTATLGLREPEQKLEGGEGGEGVHSSDAKVGVQEPPGKKVR